MNERRALFDTHDLVLGAHVTLQEDDLYYWLFIGGRDLQFSKETGKCVGGGSYLLDVPHCRYCMECQKGAEVDRE